jgi:hypothetical protein
MQWRTCGGLMVQLMCVHMLQEAYEGPLLILMRSLDLSRCVLQPTEMQVIWMA